MHPLKMHCGGTNEELGKKLIRQSAPVALAFP